MTRSLETPWTPDRQARAIAVLTRVGAVRCAPERVLAWNDVDQHADGASCVVYWMARAQRSTHNLALDCAVAASRALDLPLVVVFRRFAGPTGTQIRHLEWMLRGLGEALRGCARRGAHTLLVDVDSLELATLLDSAHLDPSLVIADDDVMPRARRGRARVAATLRVPLVTVDTESVVPGACFPKVEYAARTLRPKLHRILDQYISELGDDGDGLCAPRLALAMDPELWPGVWRVNPSAPRAELPGPTLSEWITGAVRTGTPTVAGALADQPSGTGAARDRLGRFVTQELDGYAVRRNKPEHDGTSGISPFIHFGQISPHEVVAAVQRSGAPRVDVDTFIEEFVVRRELAHNFVRWNPDAHTLAGAPAWALRTHDKHASDPREWVWDEAQLEAGDTHDPMWNAAQLQMVTTGHMHGYMRMYWAKKILEWTPAPSEAFDVALRLNDRWSLDGRDPNGITGVAWAIAGVHDRPWGERPIFGQIRYMSLASTGRKFDSKGYIARWGGMRGAALVSAPSTGGTLF